MQSLDQIRSAVTARGPKRATVAVMLLKALRGFLDEGLGQLIEHLEKKNDDQSSPSSE